MIEYTPIDVIHWVLTEEGKQLAKDGSHEARVFAAVPAGEEGLPIAELQVSKAQLNIFLLCIKYLYE